MSRKSFVVFAALFAAVFALSAREDDKLTLSGRVKEAAGRNDLTNAYVLLYDSAGNVTDSIRANRGRTWHSGAIDTLSNFYFSVPKVDSTYVFDVVCEGYKTETVTYQVSDVGSREEWREIPTIYLNRAPRQLDELTVTSTKIKFYHKGDTVVYNADAFQLAEGSMLDALIAQLPGVELNDNGQIKVNGEFVESLLLNGKEFMDGKNNVMLDNIAAYTVKNVQVYEGQTSEAKRQRDLTARKVLTMDVKLKKEYSMGWLVNAQAGYGTEDRYLAKAFASWFNSTTRVSFVGNVNNLNDSRKPGRNDTWTPEQMPSGKKSYRMAALDYNYEDADQKKSARGQATFAQSINDRYRSTDRINFLPGGDTYERSYSSSKDRELAFDTYHSAYNTINDFSFGAGLSGSYSYTKNWQSDIAGVFDEEPEVMTSEILEAIYSDGTELLESVINRQKNRTDGWHKSYSGSISPSISYKIPKTSDYISLRTGVSYISDKEEIWRDYNVNYGDNTTPTVHRRQLLDNKPNHTLSLYGSLSYNARVKDGYLSLGYRFSYSDQVKDSYMYALERLADMGIYGVVPGNYLEALDPANSYTSRQINGKHVIMPTAMLDHIFENKDHLLLYLRPELQITHRNFSYWRNNRSYNMSKTNTAVSVGSIWDGMIEYQFGFSSAESGRPSPRNTVRYSYRIEPTLPDMFDMIDVVNDADPLNIYYGNPDLKIQYAHRHLARWSYSPHSYAFNNILYVGYNHTTNSLTRGYTYDSATGIRYNRMYNASGNTRAAVTNELHWQFGSKKQFTLFSESDAAWTKYADMIGIDTEAPALFKVKQRSLNQKVRLTWQFARQSLTARCDYTNRHTTSDQQGFNTLNANHVNYGISGVFTLPAGFGISTDFMCYTRRGYGSAELDTTDPVWNARLTYAPQRNKHWVFMVDGFDLLHKLSNVSYAVTATGRTVTYTNALPRYVLFSVQYRLNIQPKKR